MNQQQFKYALRELGFLAKDREIQELARRFDQDADGNIVSLAFCRSGIFSRISIPHSTTAHIAHVHYRYLTCLCFCLQTINEFTQYVQEANVGRILSNAETKLHRILENAHSQGLEYEEAFESFDKDGDGQISHSEFSRAVQEIFEPTKITFCLIIFQLILIMCQLFCFSCNVIYSILCVPVYLRMKVCYTF